MVDVHLGWVGLTQIWGVPSAGGPFCNRRVEHPKCKSSHPRCGTTMVTLYM